MNDSTNIDLSGELDGAKNPLPGGFSRFGNISQLPSTLMQVVSAQKQSVRPWLLFFQTSNFKVPTTLPRLSKRFVRNLEYYRSNYLFVFIILFIYCMVTSPLLLLVMAGCLFLCYKLKSNPTKWKIGSYEVTPGLQYSVVALCCLPILLWAGAGSALFWVLGASVATIGLHASFYNIEAIVTEESEDQFNLLEEV